MISEPLVNDLRKRIARRNRKAALMARVIRIDWFNLAVLRAACAFAAFCEIISTTFDKVVVVVVSR